MVGSQKPLIQAARSVMARMGLNEAKRQRAAELFSEGKKPDFDLAQILDELRSGLPRQQSFASFIS